MTALPSEADIGLVLCRRTATDPLQPFVVSRFETNTNRIDSLGIIEFPLNVGAVHAIGHACGGVAHVPHGMAMSILLPFVMQYNMDVLEELYAELLLPLGGAEIFAKTFASQRAAKTVELIIELRKTLHQKAGLPINLKSVDVKREQFEEIAHTALNDGAMLPNPKHLGTQEVLNILEQAYE